MSGDQMQPSELEEIITRGPGGGGCCGEDDDFEGEDDGE